MRRISEILENQSFHELALMFFDTPYVWGGNTPEQGFDCSGLVCEVLRTFGGIGRQDLTAQGIYEKFHRFDIANIRDNTIMSGVQTDDFLFFGKDQNSITHVAIAVNNEFMVEAGGEGSRPTKEGYVRIRPISNRTDLVKVLRLK